MCAPTMAALSCHTTDCFTSISFVMEKSAFSYPCLLKVFLLAYTILAVFHFQGLADNPSITNLLSNLSMGTQESAYEDFVPEMIIQGNTVHAVWTTRVGNNEGHLFYCRSVDLGVSWEQPIAIHQYKHDGRTIDESSRRLAVDGNQVYIAICDYDYGNNGTGYIYLSRSVNNGASFETTVELANSGGGYSALTSCFIRASGSKLAIVYRDANYNNAFEGLYCLFSSNNGASFTRTSITDVNTSSISDFLFDGDRLVVLHGYAYYYYGLNVGRVYVSVSGNDGVSFTTHKISPSYTTDSGVYERCLTVHDYRYVQKLAKDGNRIHVVFVGHNSQGVWTVLYSRSDDNGQSFQEAVDINNGHISNIQSGQESLVAAAGHVYVSYLSTGSKVYLVRSENNGLTMSAPADLLTSSTYYIEKAWWPQLVIDHNDTSGKTVYFGAGAMMTRKSADGGESFSGTMFLAPFVSNIDVRGAALCIDIDGRVHWLAKARWPGNNDFDIFHGIHRQQPGAGMSNKAYLVETRRYEQYETAIVPSSPGLAFDSVMTGEAWIKMLPGSDNTSSIFAKVNGYDGASYQCPGYHMGFDNNYGKRRFLTGLQTDKGEFMNWTGTDIRDTLWHHVAFTYDAHAGLNNFKSYLDGLLVAEQTVTGSIIPGDGLLMIGTRQYMLHENSTYLLDDIRLWNRALSQEELLENQLKTFTGEEEGLRLWLSFDDTFRDMSGHGNDAIPVYLGEMVASDFDPPVAGFDMVRTGNQITFSNKSVNATSFQWNFGDNNTSEVRSPKHIYAVAGEYLASMKAFNSSAVTAAVKPATIPGLEKVVPASGGNNGYATLKVYGGGIGQATAFLLRKESETDITGEGLKALGNGVLAATFDLGGKATGQWDVVVETGQAGIVLPAAFTIEEAVIEEPWLSFSGRGTVLVNMWYSYTIQIGNDGNTDLYGIPWWFAVSDTEGLEVELIDFEVAIPEVASELGMHDYLANIPPYISTDRVMHEAFDARVYGFLIPQLPANSTLSFRIRIKSPEMFKVRTWLTSPLMEYDAGGDKATAASKEALNAVEDFVWCLASSFAEQAFDVGAMMLGNVGCIIQGAKSIYKHYEISHSNQKNQVYNISYHHLITIAQCAMTYANFPLATYYSIALNFLDFIRDASECSKAFMGISGYEGFVWTVLSFDPNEMVGPSGHGEQNYIPKNSSIPYTVYFENKNEATAPAHIVSVTDTLDLAVFDISRFGFGSFGWGDTLFSPPGSNLKEFSVDIDLRPQMELITRVSARLDTISGVINWELISLNPETMELEEDPFIGFLPPNNNPPEGDGFVSFTVGLKEGLTTNDEIRNKASIVFDANAPIITNEYLNTIDNTTPESRVLPLENTTPNHFELSWSGSDDGAGIRDYTVYMLVNDTLLVAWQKNTPETSAIFSGEVGYTYKFYSIATDHVGHMEVPPGNYDAWTTLTVDVPDIGNGQKPFAIYPNPASGSFTIAMANMAVLHHTNIDVYNQLGELMYSTEMPSDQQHTVNTANWPEGVYFVRISADHMVHAEKLILTR